MRIDICLCADYKILKSFFQKYLSSQMNFSISFNYIIKILSTKLSKFLCLSNQSKSSIYQTVLSRITNHNKKIQKCNTYLNLNNICSIGKFLGNVELSKIVSIERKCRNDILCFLQFQSLIGLCVHKGLCSRGKNIYLF